MAERISPAWTSCHRTQDGSKSICPTLTHAEASEKVRTMIEWWTCGCVMRCHAADSRNHRQTCGRQSDKRHFLQHRPCLDVLMQVFPAVVWSLSLTSPLTTCGISLIRLHDWCYNNAVWHWALALQTSLRLPQKFFTQTRPPEFFLEMPLSH